MQEKTKIAILASGTGSNADAIIQFFKNHAAIEVDVVISNKPGAKVLDVAKKHQVEGLLLDKKADYESDRVGDFLEKRGVKWVILAGFLLKIPNTLVEQFANRIINIHPSLLPEYGGKGMYGMHVHRAVKDAGEKNSGITIHLVDEVFDNGERLFQASCELDERDTPETIQQKVQQLEQEHFAPVIEKTILVHG